MIVLKKGSLIKSKRDGYLRVLEVVSEKCVWFRFSESLVEDCAPLSKVRRGDVYDLNLSKFKWERDRIKSEEQLEAMRKASKAKERPNHTELLNKIFNSGV